MLSVSVNMSCTHKQQQALMLAVSVNMSCTHKHQQALMLAVSVNMSCTHKQQQALMLSHGHETLWKYGVYDRVRKYRAVALRTLIVLSGSCRVKS